MRPHCTLSTIDGRRHPSTRFYGIRFFFTQSKSFLSDEQSVLFAALQKWLPRQFLALVRTYKRPCSDSKFHCCAMNASLLHCLHRDLVFCIYVCLTTHVVYTVYISSTHGSIDWGRKDSPNHVFPQEKRKEVMLFFLEDPQRDHFPRPWVPQCIWYRNIIMKHQLHGFSIIIQ